MPSIAFIKQVGPITWAGRYFVRQFFKVILRRGITIKLPTGLKYYAPPWDQSGSEVYVTGADMDWGSEKLLSDVLEKNGAFIDVGAHTGYYSLYMLPRVSWVYAFEPDRQAYGILSQYQAKYDNLFCFREAVSNKTGQMEIQEMGRGFSYINDASHDQQDTPVDTDLEVLPTIKLDDYIDTYKAKVCGIKIDVDGGDLDVLEGAELTINKFKPVVLIECRIRDYERLLSICEQLDYTIYAFVKTEQNQRDFTFTCLSHVPDSDTRFKMLFLVPKEKTETFNARCS